jgi:hypothetical protein
MIVMKKRNVFNHQDVNAHSETVGQKALNSYSILVELSHCKSLVEKCRGDLYQHMLWHHARKFFLSYSLPQQITSLQDKKYL